MRAILEDNIEAIQHNLGSITDPEIQADGAQYLRDCQAMLAWVDRYPYHNVHTAIYPAPLFTEDL